MRSYRILLALLLVVSSAAAWGGSSGSESRGSSGGEGGATSCGELSDDAPSCSTDATDAANISSGVLSPDRVPALSTLSGAVTDAQVPNNVTIDLATQCTTALAGDSATSFFAIGTFDPARLGSGTPSSSNWLRGDGAWTALPADDDVPESGDFGALGLTGPVTSIGVATAIAADAITEPKLDSDNAPTDAFCLSYVGSSGRMRWVTCGGGGANTALSNLASVAINTNLLGAVSGGMSVVGGPNSGDDLFLIGSSNVSGGDNNRVYVKGDSGSTRRAVLCVNGPSGDACIYGPDSAATYFLFPGGLARFSTGSSLIDINNADNMLLTPPSGKSVVVGGAARVVYSGAAPTVGGSCGTSPTIGGTNGALKITTGTGSPTSCVATFSTAWTTAPVCVANAATTTTALNIATTTTTVTVSAAALTAGEIIHVLCMGY